jgi:hypothetical protein
MNEKEFNNKFRFALYQGNILLCEKAFDADVFNPFTRYSIDIRDILPRAITKLQKTLSKKKYYYTTIDCGRIDVTKEDSGRCIYGLYAHHQHIIDTYPKEIRSDLRYNPAVVTQQVEDYITKEVKTIRGVECKIGFYINDNPIVERIFYVDGYDPIARWSTDVTDAVIEVANSIFDKIKICDIKNMWDDYDLINIRGLSINQIRELSTFKREELLGRIRRN